MQIIFHALFLTQTSALHRNEEMYETKNIL